VDYHRVIVIIAKTGVGRKGGTASYVVGYSQRVALIAYCQREKRGRVHVPGGPETVTFD
jgi:hypothetical protein